MIVGVGVVGAVTATVAALFVAQVQKTPPTRTDLPT
jgi:hypothetical protein